MNNRIVLNNFVMDELSGKLIQLNIAGALIFGIFGHDYKFFKVGNVGDFCPACFEVELIEGCFILHQVKL